MEMMLALAIFVIALAPTARVLNNTLGAYLAVEENQALHTALINHTNFLLASSWQEGTFESAHDDYPGITVTTVIDPYEPEIDNTDDEEFVAITDVFVITIKATGKDGELENTFYLRKLN